jgi:hypothetical protein
LSIQRRRSYDLHLAFSLLVLLQNRKRTLTMKMEECVEIKKEEVEYNDEISSKNKMTLYWIMMWTILLSLPA